MSENFVCLNTMVYATSEGNWRPKKRGLPKNAGISDDVYENKGQKKCLREYPTMSMKINDLAFLSDDADENTTG